MITFHGCDRPSMNAHTEHRQTPLNHNIHRLRAGSGMATEKAPKGRKWIFLHLEGITKPTPLSYILTCISLPISQLLSLITILKTWKVRILHLCMECADQN